MAIEICRTSGAHVRHPHRQSKLVRNDSRTFVARRPVNDVVGRPPPRSMNLSLCLPDISKTTSVDGVVESKPTVDDRRRRNTVGMTPGDRNQQQRHRRPPAGRRHRLQT